MAELALRNEMESNKLIVFRGQFCHFIIIIILDKNTRLKQFKSIPFQKKWRGSFS
jgi:hypothetical protein